MTKEELIALLNEKEGDIECFTDEQYNAIEVISNGRWISDHKYEHLIDNVIKLRETGEYVLIDISRAGSHFTDWDYQYNGAHHVVPVEVVKTEWKLA